MPEYKYFCPAKGCKKTVKIWHLMSECDNPTLDIRLLTYCKKHKVQMERQIFEPILQGSVGGTFPKESELRAKKQAQRKLRSRYHFKNDVLPKLPKEEREYFAPKYKHLPKKDHEKM